MSEATGKYRVIDFSARRTDAEWGDTWQSFLERAATTWFNWLRWVLSIGAFAVIAAKTGSRLLNILTEFSLWIMAMYFVAFFGSIRIEPITSRLVGSPTWRGKVLLFCLIAVGLLPAYGARYLIEHVVMLLQVRPGGF
jgi:hypothetical protein